MGLAQKDIRQDNHKTVTTENPATGKPHKTYALHTKEEAEEIIEDTHDAFLSWRETKMADRAKIIAKIGELLREKKDSFAQMMTDQMGKPIEQAKQEVELCAAICDYTAKEGPKHLEDEERSFEGGRAVISYQPLGVILGMQPWNFPLYQALRYSVAVILAGNTTVFKHATICWETAEKLEETFREAGLPKNVFSVIYVEDETVDELIAHEKVRGVTFTGSAKAGKIVAKAAGAVLKKAVLELGGSDPYIVLDDADIDLAVKTCVEGRLINGGQTCTAAKRFIVLEDVYDEFETKFVESMKNATFGDPNDPSNDYGSMARKDLLEKLDEQVTESVKKGAKILCGGKPADREGYFYPPTVLTDIPKDSPAYKDELFGPVAVLFKVKDENEALELANDHRYGLGGGVFSRDEKRALKLARSGIDTGMVNINGYFSAQPNLPFGGVKESGYGREHGGFGVREFVNIKSILMADTE